MKLRARHLPMLAGNTGSCNTLVNVQHNVESVSERYAVDGISNICAYKYNANNTRLIGSKSDNDTNK